MYLRIQGRERTEAELRRIVCSVKFELLEQANAFRLLGPEMSYHAVDPHLPVSLRKFDAGLTVPEILSYRSGNEHFDLCFEDSWTGHFIAQRFERQSRRDDLVLIHLDDHTDMMPTLLCESAETLTDATSGAAFDPTSPEDWEAAICSGAINIGNFITPFFYSGCNIHVRHIGNSIECDETCFVVREPCRYELIPGKQFAAIGKRGQYSRHSVGTYMAVPTREGIGRHSSCLDSGPYRSRLFHQ